MTVAMPPVFVSVIVPCFNCEAHLAQCLRALAAQTYPRDQYEVILVDNNSTDRSAEIGRGFAGVTVCHEPTQGSYAARNCGIRHARGEILAFTDADCEVCPTWIEELAQALSRPEVMVVLGGRRHATESCGLALAADYDAQKTAYVCSQSDPRLLYGYTNNQAMRRTAFEHCGPFLEVARGGDTVMVGRVAEAYGASAVRYVPAARIRHLEIDQLWDWYAKLYTYGRSYRNYRQWCDARPLTLRDRVAVLEQTIADRGYTWPKALALAALLGGGVVAYEVGRHVTWRP